MKCLLPFRIKIRCLCKLVICKIKTYLRRITEQTKIENNLLKNWENDVMFVICCKIEIIFIILSLYSADSWNISEVTDLLICWDWNPAHSLYKTLQTRRNFKGTKLVIFSRNRRFGPQSPQGTILGCFENRYFPFLPSKCSLSETGPKTNHGESKMKECLGGRRVLTMTPMQ